MAVKILHTADIHLGAPMTSFGDTASERTRTLRSTFLKVCELAVEREVDLFFCAGDLFDSIRPEAEDVECARKGFARLKQAGVICFAVPGGHDGAGTQFNALDAFNLPGLKVLGDKDVSAPLRVQVRDETVNLYSIAARPGVPVRLETIKRRNLPGFHVAMMHASVLAPGQADAPAKDIPVTIDQLAQMEMDYIALGHYHDFRILETEQRTLGCYPGTIEAKRFSETGPRRVAIVTLAGPGLHIEPVEVGATMVEKIELSVQDIPDTDAAIRAVFDRGGPQKYARVIISGLRETMLDMERIETEASAGYKFLQLIDDTQVAGDADVRAIAGEPTVRGLAVARLLKMLDEARDDDDRRRLTSALRLTVHEFELNRKGRAS